MSVGKTMRINVDPNLRLNYEVEIEAKDNNYCIHDTAEINTLLNDFSKLKRLTIGKALEKWSIGLSIVTLKNGLKTDLIVFPIKDFPMEEYLQFRQAKLGLEERMFGPLLRPTPKRPEGLILA